jgi:hypothetical protein
MHIVADFIAILLLKQHALFSAVLSFTETLLLLEESELCGAGGTAGIRGEK